MAKVSVIIPSRNERFMPQTVADVLKKAAGEVEVIVVLEGYWPDPLPLDDKRVTLVHRPVALGMRNAINAGAAIAKGDYLLKCDGHCMFGEGYDEILKADCDDNWVVTPARYSLDAENWAILQTGKSRVDYHYLSYPYSGDSGAGLHGVQWNQRARERVNNRAYDVDDEMSFQGSCWFTTAKHFARLGGMDEKTWGMFYHEPQELGLKTWLGGGEGKTNKKTWYAHLHKGKQYGRGYHMPSDERGKYTPPFTDFWMHDRWEGQTSTLEKFIERFSPVPTWPADILGNWGKYADGKIIIPHG